MEEMSEAIVGRRPESNRLTPTVKETFVIENSPIEFSIWDFRKNKTGAPVEKLNIFFDGIGQYEEPNEMKAALIEKAQAENAVLILPRVPKLLPGPDPTIEARYIFEALNSESFEHKIAEHNLKIKSQEIKDLHITAFSEGCRSAENFANLFDKIPQQEGFTRKLELWGLVGAVDLSDKPDGKTAFSLFCKELFGITIEEMRLRLNSEIEQHPERFKQLGLNLLPVQSTAGTVLTSVHRLFESPFGTSLFATHLKDAWGKNIAFIPPIIKRLLTAPKGKIYESLAKNEIRSQACNGLTSFDVDLKLPRFDGIIPPVNLGRQIITNLDKLPPDTKDLFLKSIPLELQNDPLGLGVWILKSENPSIDLQKDELLGRILFPKAKSVRTILLGDLSDTKIAAEQSQARNINQILATNQTVLSQHLAPLINPKTFIYS